MEGSLVAQKFRVERLLGEGGMGRVFLAEHLDLERPVAIKIVRDELALCEDVVERLLREARTAAKLRSDHVARVLDAGRLEGGAPYIVMEYLEGCDLDDLLERRGALPSEEAVGFVIQACDGIAEAHALGIAHRDLKPENLFLTTRADGSPIVKVLDFGISKSMRQSSRSLTNPTMVVGSPDYMSPEQMQGRDLAGLETDIWSLGAVLYALVTARRPFAADSVQGVYARVLAQEPLAPAVHAALPEGLSEVILRCLRKNSADRYASVAELARALAPFGPEGSDELADSIARVAAQRARSGPSHGAALGAIADGPPSEPRRERKPPTPTPSGRGIPEPFATTVGAPPALGNHPFRERRKRVVWAGSIALACAALGFGWAALGASRHETLRDVDATLGDVARPEAAEEARVESSLRFGVAPSESLATSSAKPHAPPAITASPSPIRKDTPPPRSSPSASRSGLDPWNPDAFGGRM